MKNEFEICEECKKVLTDENMARCSDYMICACGLCKDCAEKLETKTKKIIK